jgi:hypothetical protein
LDCFFTIKKRRKKKERGMTTQDDRAKLFSRWIYSIATNAGKELSATDMATIAAAVYTPDADPDLDTGLLIDVEGVLSIISQADNRPPPCASCCQQHIWND